MNKTYIIISLIIGLSILGYGLIANSQKQAQLDYVKQQAATKQANLNNCLQNAFDSYTQQWNYKVSTYGTPENVESNTLPGYIAKPIEDEKKATENMCIKLWK